MPTLRLDALTKLTAQLKGLPVEAPQRPVRVGSRIGLYGRPERMRQGSKLVKKRPTEITACKLIFDPNDPEFIPAPAVPSKLYCFKCRARKPHGAFGKDKRCVNRAGRRCDCNQCREKSLKLSRIEKHRTRKAA